VKEYWEGRFQREGKIWGETPSTTARRALEIFRQHAAKDILVPGAGYGRNTRLFSEAGLHTVGVEISSEALALARQFDPATEFFCGSVLEVSFPAASFDAVYCFNLLHLFRRRDREKLLAACRGMLRKGGIVFFVVFCELEDSFGKGAQVEPNTFESKPGRPVHYFTEADLCEHFRAFDIVETGLAKDHEEHGAEGPHVHTLRYICGVNRGEAIARGGGASA